MESSSDKENGLGMDAEEIDRILSRKKRVRAQAMSLAEYRGLFAGTTPPNDKQVAGFAEYLARSHSWYKHLPPSLPGAPFQIYLNPQAGMDMIETRDGKTAYAPRPDDAKGFHYSWMPTSRYRSRFGSLDYFTDKGTQFLVSVEISTGTGTADGLIDVDPTWPFVFDPRSGDFHQLPPEVRSEGLVHLTSAVHENALYLGYWLLSWDILEGDSVLHWPEALGGQRTEKQLLELRAAHERLYFLGAHDSQDKPGAPASGQSEETKPSNLMGMPDNERLREQIMNEFSQIIGALRELHLSEIRSAAQRVIRLVYT